MPQFTEKLQQERKQLQKEVRERALAYIVAALGFVAGFAWNDAMKALIEYLFPLSQDTLLAKFFYALFVTLVVIIVTVYLTRFLTSKNEEEKKDQ